MRYRSVKNIKPIVASDYSKQIIFPGQGHLFQIVTIPPKTKQREHYHTEQTELFYIASGHGILFLDNQKFAIASGDAFLCEVGEKHKLWNESTKPLQILVFKFNKPKEDDTVWEGL